MGYTQARMAAVDARVKAIADRLASGLEALLERDCDQLRLNWEWERSDGRVLDSGEISIRRGKEGAYLVCITSSWGKRRAARPQATEQGLG